MLKHQLSRQSRVYVSKSTSDLRRPPRIFQLHRVVTQRRYVSNCPFRVRNKRDLDKGRGVRALISSTRIFGERRNSDAPSRSRYKGGNDAPASYREPESRRQGKVAAGSNVNLRATRPLSAGEVQWKTRYDSGIRAFEPRRRGGCKTPRFARMCKSRSVNLKGKNLIARNCVSSYCTLARDRVESIGDDNF